MRPRRGCRLQQPPGLGLAEGLAHALLPRRGPAARRARRRGRGAGAAPPAHTSTYGVPVTSTCGRLTSAAVRASLLPAHEVVDQHAEATAGPGRERPHHVGQVVDAVEALHHHALDPEVVAPHLLDQLGVVDALDEDPAGPGHAGRRAGHGHRARRRAPGRRRRRPAGGAAPGSTVLAGDREGAGRPSEAGARRRCPLRSTTKSPWQADDPPEEARGAVGDLRAPHRLDRRVGGPQPGRSVHRPAEDAAPSPCARPRAGERTGGSLAPWRPKRAPRPQVGGSHPRRPATSVSSTVTERARAHLLELLAAEEDADAARPPRRGHRGHHVGVHLRPLLRPARRRRARRRRLRASTACPCSSRPRACDGCGAARSTCRARASCCATRTARAPTATPTSSPSRGRWRSASQQVLDQLVNPGLAGHGGYTQLHQGRGRHRPPAHGRRLPGLRPGPGHAHRRHRGGDRRRRPRDHPGGRRHRPRRRRPPVLRQPTA